MLIKKYSFAFLQRAIAVYYKLQKKEKFVLMFHGVAEDFDASDSLNIRYSSFCELISSLKNSSTVFSSANGIFENGKSIIITFDDVFADAADNAIPFLETNSIPYALFVSPSLIDTEGYITSEQLRALSDNPLCTVGFHSNRHVFFRGLSEKEVEKEIDCSGFETAFDVKCDYFAYPYGSVRACSFKSIRVLANSKYKAAFGTINCASNSKSSKKHPFYVPRIVVSEKSWKKVLSEVLS